MASLRRVIALVGCVLLYAAAGLIGAGAARADTVRAAQWYLSALGFERAWTITKGTGVTVAVIDTGVDPLAAGMRSAVVGGRDFSGFGPADGVGPTDGGERDHGTTVGSVLAARGTGPDRGVIGAAPAVSVLTASVGTTQSVQTINGIANAIRWAADQGVGVINLSSGGSPLPQVVAALRYAEKHDVVIVAATGNNLSAGENSPVSFPADEPGVVGVSGVNADLSHNSGAVSGRGTAISGPFATRPGTTSADGLPVATRHDSPSAPYDYNIGTSVASPIVAGVVAMIRAHFPNLDAANVINRLLKSATPAGGSVPNTTYGYGVVNAYAALTKQIPMVTANPLGSLVPPTSSSSVPSSSGPTTSSPGTAVPSSGPVSQPPPAASSSSSGLGAGAWIGIAAVVVVAAVVLAVIAARYRRQSAPAGPPGYGPPNQPPGPPGGYPPANQPPGPPPGRR